MTRQQKLRDAKKEQLREWMRSNGYKEDRYGNWVRETSGGIHYRFKFQPLSLRKEVKDTYDNNPAWVGLWTAYYRDVMIETEGRMIVARRIA